MSRFSTVLSLTGEAYGDGRSVEVDVSLCHDTGEVRIDLYDESGSLRDVVLTAEKRSELRDVL